MITVTLCASSGEDARRRGMALDPAASGVELRLDSWAEIPAGELRRSLELLRRRFETVIVTWRLPQDGGACQIARAQRNRRLGELIDEFLPEVWLDLEIEQLNQPDDSRLVTAAQAAGVRLIRSCHAFEPGLDMQRLQALEQIPADQLAKAAVMPGSTADLLQLLQFARSFRPGFQVILGMGEWGIPSRICPRVFGSCWTYAAETARSAAAPGQLGAAELARKYRTHLHHPDTRYFAIFGNPVMHSKSPEFHNERFAEAGKDAAYIPFPLSDATLGEQVIRQWPLQGVSITIPHKHGALGWESAEPVPAVQAVGAANTAVVAGHGIELLNTDVEGFLHPLQERGLNLRGMHCLVIGAGGAARAIVYGLLSSGAQVLVLNRTASRADDLAAAMMQTVPHSTVLAAELPSDGDVRRVCAECWGQDPGLIVQTTQVGMEPAIDADPISGYRFSGDELVYDIIYTPEHTALLRRAAGAGCPVITGRMMFIAQAEAQSRRFLQQLDSRPGFSAGN
ncbi:type I 3-dehydroquinate dehydratase [Spirochaeta africana]|uniref:shikimate dehydrogenase (NADP(+)) n=1 Tax=Spirochaeta africana (strain ATCC 700263 / DSM 8902 / Z-7692) TaxID=889378 RepID=H9UMK7_SPIAZ|nr:type I 3-dehydroquinate dehydratase [Spirochaeta africana]AFG38750.1 shikimate 5-dehydrogenase [Spirochaeta africana DSM 8902]